MISRPSFYAIIPAHVRYSENLSPNSKLLYGEITALCSKEGYCWATNKYFSDLYKVSKVSISRWIAELKLEGFIKIEDGKAAGFERKIFLNFQSNDPELEFKDAPPIIKNDNRYNQKHYDPIIKNDNSYNQKRHACINTSITKKINKNKGGGKSPSSPNVDNFLLRGKDLIDYIMESFRNWFNKSDPHPVADIKAIGKVVLAYAGEIEPGKLADIIDRAFERVIQEKERSEWLTREVIVRIKWGVEDVFKLKERSEALIKSIEIKDLPVDSGKTGEIIRELLSEIKSRNKTKIKVEEIKPGRKKLEEEYNQALERESKN